MGSSPTRGSSFFFGKVTALGVLCCLALIVDSMTLLASFFLPFASLINMYIVLCCFALFVCLTLLASFFLPSHLSLKTCTCIYTSDSKAIS